MYHFFILILCERQKHMLDKLKIMYFVQVFLTCKCEKATRMRITLVAI